jgi:hypothetical protein
MSKTSTAVNIACVVLGLAGAFVLGKNWNDSDKKSNIQISNKAEKSTAPEILETEPKKDLEDAVDVELKRLESNPDFDKYCKLREGSWYEVCTAFEKENKLGLRLDKVKDIIVNKYERENPGWKNMYHEKKERRLRNNVRKMAKEQDFGLAFLYTLEMAKDGNFVDYCAKRLEIEDNLPRIREREKKPKEEEDKEARERIFKYEQEDPKWKDYYKEIKGKVKASALFIIENNSSPEFKEFIFIYFQEYFRDYYRIKSGVADDSVKERFKENKIDFEKLDKDPNVLKAYNLLKQRKF